MKRRLILLLTVLSLVFSLFLSSCGAEYEPQESSEEEKETVMTLGIEKKEYDVAYELYRALFLSLKASVDGGDETVWNGAEKNKYIEKIDALILERISEIYAVFHLCDKAGIDVYSREVDSLIEDYIRIAVEGGSINGERFVGFNGDYAAYLADLNSMYINYSVQELYIRYSIALERLNTYYIGSLDGENLKGGEIKYTKDEVEDFYYDSNESRRMIRVHLSPDAFTEKRANEIRSSIASKKSENEIINYIIHFSTSGAADIKNGEVVGKYTLDKFYYSDITDSLFSLSVGEVGEVIKINSDNTEGFNIIYRTDVNKEHFEDCYDDIVKSYLLNEAGKKINDTAISLIESAKYTVTLENLDRSSVKMN